MQTIDYAGLVQAIVLLITALTLAINLWNQRQIAELKQTTHEINGNIQKQLDQKKDKLTPG